MEENRDGVGGKGAPEMRRVERLWWWRGR